jgi:hypothetical protein
MYAQIAAIVVWAGVVVLALTRLIAALVCQKRSAKE